VDFRARETRRRGRRRRQKSNERTTNGGIDVFVAASFRECYYSYHNLSDIPKDVLVNEIIRRFAPEPPYYNLMLCT